MKTTVSLLMAALLLVAGAAQAQLYKWVGADGKVTYSDVPPPKTAKQIEQKDLTGGGGAASSTAGLPYELAQAANNHPVTLFTGSQCEPCDEARNFLKQRGIPFSEKTVTSNEDIARLKQLTNNGSLPAMTVGSNKQVGFESNAWGQALTSAGYPATNMLPKSWRQSAAEALAPKAAVVKVPPRGQATQAKESTPQSVPPPAGNAPPGFRF